MYFLLKLGIGAIVGWFLTAFFVPTFPVWFGAALGIVVAFLITNTRTTYLAFCFTVGTLATPIVAVAYFVGRDFNSGWWIAMVIVFMLFLGHAAFDIEDSDGLPHFCPEPGWSGMSTFEWLRAGILGLFAIAVLQSNPVAIVLLLIWYFLLPKRFKEFVLHSLVLLREKYENFSAP